MEIKTKQEAINLLKNKGVQFDASLSANELKALAVKISANEDSNNWLSAFAEIETTSHTAKVFEAEISLENQLKMLEENSSKFQTSSFADRWVGKVYVTNIIVADKATIVKYGEEDNNHLTSRNVTFTLLKSAEKAVIKEKVVAATIGIPAGTVATASISNRLLEKFVGVKASDRFLLTGEPEKGYIRDVFMLTTRVKLED